MIHTILLIRHGQSHANAGGVTVENPIVPLTDLGTLQARTLAALLPATAPAILSSPFMRARDTAAPYCSRLGLEAGLYEDLREFEAIDTLTMRGTTCSHRESVLARYWLEADPDQRTGPAGETFREFHERVARVLTRYLPTLPHGSVIFGHGMWMAMLFWQMWGFSSIDTLSMARFRRFQLGFPMPNAATYAVSQLAPGRWELKADQAAMLGVAAIGVASEQPANADVEPLRAG